MLRLSPPGPVKERALSRMRVLPERGLWMLLPAPPASFMCEWLEECPMLGTSQASSPTMDDCWLPNSLSGVVRPG